jgi:hypothetical protein
LSRSARTPSAQGQSTALEAAGATLLAGAVTLFVAETLPALGFVSGLLLFGSINLAFGFGLY